MGDFFNSLRPAAYAARGITGFTLAAILGATQATAATTPTVLYTYDLDDRVTTAMYLNGQNGIPSTCVSYTYDAAGNRLTQSTTLTGGQATPTWGTGAWGCFNWTAQGGQFARHPGVPTRSTKPLPHHS